jgi:transcription elongation factor SPT5
LTRKYLTKEYSGQPLLIKSAVARDDLKGYVYIEAYKQAHVMQAIEKVNGIYASSKVVLVPTKEMVEVLTIHKNVVTISAGQWVRLKRGKYAGDLAQVVDEVDGEVATLKVIPRLEINTVTEEGDNGKRKKTQRPPAKLFDPHSINKLDKNGVSKTKNFWHYKGENFKDGFLIKDFKVATLDTENVNPSLEEISKFVSGDQDLRDLSISNVNAGKSVDFDIGDTVEVIEGDLIHLMGTVESVTDNIIKVKPQVDDLKESLTFRARQLRKFFKVGDHVTVINGQKQGETGLIIKVEENIITLFSELSMTEVSVFLISNPVPMLC